MLDETFQKKVALVTGGSRGIGQAITLRMAQAGADVVINYRKSGGPSEKEGQRMRDQCGAMGRRALLVEADIAKKTAVDQMFKSMDDAYGQLDFLILNAAKTTFKPLERLLERELRQLVDINYLGNLYCVQAALPLLERTQGKIVFISSLGGRFYFPNYPLGSMKAAMDSMVRDLAESLRPRNITVNGVCGGIVRTDVVKALRLYWEDLARFPDDLYVEPDEIAEVVYFLCSPASQGIRGQTILVDRGMSNRVSLAPHVTSQWI